MDSEARIGLAQDDLRYEILFVELHVEPLAIVVPRAPEVVVAGVAPHSQLRLSVVGRFTGAKRQVHQLAGLFEEDGFHGGFGNGFADDQIPVTPNQYRFGITESRDELAGEILVADEERLVHQRDFHAEERAEPVNGPERLAEDAEDVSVLGMGADDALDVGPRRGAFYAQQGMVSRAVPGSVRSFANEPLRRPNRLRTGSAFARRDGSARPDEPAADT